MSLLSLQTITNLRYHRCRHTCFVKKMIEVLIGIVCRTVRSIVNLLSLALLLTLLVYLWFGGVLTFIPVILSLLAMLYQYQDLLLYHTEQPDTSRHYIPSPSLLHIPYDNIHIQTDDGLTIHAYLIKPHDQQPIATIIYFHGNAGNIGHRLVNATEMSAFFNANILLVEYRGYGKSEGSPSEQGLYKDGQAAVEYILSRKDIANDKVFLFGRSLGGAIAIHTAAHLNNASRLAGLIVENTFTSIPDIARILFDIAIIRCVPCVLYKNKYMSISKVNRLSIPTLFLSGTADQLIPAKMVLKLYETCSAERKRLVRVKSGTHNDTWSCPGYYDAFNNFITQVVDGVMFEPTIVTTGARSPRSAWSRAI